MGAVALQIAGRMICETARLEADWRCERCPNARSLYVAMQQS